MAIVIGVGLVRGHLFALMISSVRTAYAQAHVLPPEKIFGDWEVSQVLLARGHVSRASHEGGYAWLLVRTYNFRQNSVTYGQVGQPGNLVKTYTKKQLPLKALFQEEKVRRPLFLKHNAMLKGVREYALKEALGTNADKQFTLYAYDDQKLMFMTLGAAPITWFAALADVIVLPDSVADDGITLLILRRPPKERAAEHTAFCNTATSAIDKAVCSDRALWKLRHFIDATTVRAASKPARAITKLSEEQLAAAADLNQCKPDGSTCIRDALDRHAKLIGSYIPPTKQCVNGEYKDLPVL